MITSRPRRFAGVAALALVAAGTLASCGSSGSSSTSTDSSTTAAAAGQAAGPGGDSTQMAAIQECLSAAGISMPAPPDGQPGQGSGQPSGQPTGAPSGMPSTGGAGGPGGGLFSDAKVVAALKACGITVPTAGPGQGGSLPSASATS